MKHINHISNLILCLLICIIQCVCYTIVSGQTKDITWKELEPGLFFARIDAPVKSHVGDSRITILKIDPDYFNFKLVSAKEKPEKNKTAEEWAKSEGLVAVVNAGMYRISDFKTNVSYMKNYDFINNGSLSHDNSMLAFNRKTETVPKIQIIDLRYEDWEEWKYLYNSYIQGIRMIDCKQTNRWSQQDKRFSMVCIAMDKKGKVLFIFTRSPYSVHDFINMLLSLPLEIYNAQYLEGGPEASLYINTGSFEWKQFGSFETGFVEHDKNDIFWAIPNVIGITTK